MLRNTVGVSFCVMFLLGAAGACSSKSTDDADSAGGKGDILTAGTGGTSTAGGGATGRAGGGTATDDCATKPTTCIDAATASFCDPTTGMDVTTSCTTDAAALGLVSKGCDATIGDCTIDDYADPACADGAVPFAVCANLTEDQLLPVYSACYTDEQGLHAIVTCFADYVDLVAQTVDCGAAVDACLPDAGAGGAADDGAAGAPAADGAGGAGGAGG